VEDFRRDWRAGDQSGLRKSWLDPEHVVRRYRSRGLIERMAHEHGLSVGQMEAVIRHDAEKRRKLFAARRGRPRAEGPPDYHFEWAAQFDLMRAELSRQHEEREHLGLLEPGDRPPSDRDVNRAVAELDWQASPERWPRDSYPHAPGDPESLDPHWEKPAIDRVAKAVKALQRAATENP
jgi:hypothetical protein